MSTCRVRCRRNVPRGSQARQPEEIIDVVGVALLRKVLSRKSISRHECFDDARLQGQGKDEKPAKDRTRRSVADRGGYRSHLHVARRDDRVDAVDRPRIAMAARGRQRRQRAAGVGAHEVAQDRTERRIHHPFGGAADNLEEPPQLVEVTVRQTPMST